MSQSRISSSPSPPSVAKRRGRSSGVVMTEAQSIVFTQIVFLKDIFAFLGGEDYKSDGAHTIVALHGVHSSWAECIEGWWSEREQRMVAPLVNEMVATLQRHGLTSSLQSDIDQYRAQVMRSQAAASASPGQLADGGGGGGGNASGVASTPGSAAKPASAMGRSAISPM